MTVDVPPVTRLVAILNANF